MIAGSLALEEQLEKYFHLKSFRGSQKDIIERIVSGKDVFVLMPTGAGKSLCYQLPALLLPQMTVVISPLIALMNEQVLKLRKIGIDAGYLNSSLDYPRYQRAVELIQQKRIKILYVAPETLQKASVINLFHQVGVSFFAVDEAHCISQWGHDFRKEYRQLNTIRQEFPKATFGCFTASATKEVIKDIQNLLQLDDENLIKNSFHRANLNITVKDDVNEVDEMIDFVSKHSKQSGIIYCSSKKRVEEMAAHLRAMGIKALPYHAGFDFAYRKECHEKFLNGEIHVVVATIAFGMGIDKENVRFVLHMDIPKTLEHYYQEIGRAGRDGESANCLLLYHPSDVKKMHYLLKQGEDDALKEIAMKKFDAMTHFCTTSTCRTKVLLSYFSQTLSNDCQNCDNCLN